MSRDLFYSSARRHCRSSALVITLAALVLVCALLLLFFDQSTLSRQISFSSAGQYRADQAAHTALDTIVGDLRNEIVAGSTTYTSNNISLYIPTTNFTAVPYRVSDQGFPNLVAQSASSSNFWTGSYYNASVFNPIRSAPNNSTATASANGRYIKVNEWNKPGLLGDPGSSTSPAMPGAYTAPDWVLITRQGAVTNALTLPAVGPGAGTLSDKSATNPNYVIGRYAYTIYDEGGLLDVNVAGFPSSVSSTDFTTKRGLLPQVDLANIPGVNNASALVQWRNAATAATATTYTNYVFTATNGFTTVAANPPGDQAFVSRQDLINYAQANSGQVATSALQYLGTFTRDLDAPSFTPNPSRARIQSAYSTYGLPVGLDDQFNPSLINTRVTTSFTRSSDGTPAQVGEPLIKYRFPLSRLSWISPTGPNGATATQIHDSFGLTWSTTIVADAEGHTESGWIYNHGASDRILTLSQVAAEAREPDFFELLQAAIQVGSLGKSQGGMEGSNTTGIDSDDYYHVLSIGANIIDQANPGSYPTLISFNPPSDAPGFVLCGQKNLPYINRLIYMVMRFPDSSDGYNAPNVGGWIQVEMWNPNAKAQTPVANGPTQFRIIAEGTTHIGASSDGSLNNHIDGPDQTINSQNSAITFSVNAANNFSQPTLLSPSNAATTASQNEPLVPSGSSPFIGIFQGEVSAPDSRIQTPASNDKPYTFVNARSGSASDQSIPPYVKFFAQYWNGSAWVTYQVLPYIDAQANTYDPDNEFLIPLNPVWAMNSDPRPVRFGRGMYYGPPNSGDTIWPSLSTLYAFSGNQDTPAYPGWTYVPSSSDPNRQLMGGVSINSNSPSITHYADPDGTVRRADGAYNSGTTDGLPLIDSNFSSRPYNLNRPFRSVADLGYVYRDIPWKQLDFFTDESGDSALLDLFSLNEPPPAGLEAGVLDLNSRQAPVLKAMLQGAIQMEDTPSSNISATDASSIAQALVTFTSSPTSGPFANRSELVSRGSDLFTYASGTTPGIIKRQREAAVRALSSTVNTRTWNLLIDVIAQSGRYPATASAAATPLNQFVVDGERRYWLHVAIDRYTGKVLDQYLEPVYDE